MTESYKIIRTHIHCRSICVVCGGSFKKAEGKTDISVNNVFLQFNYFLCRTYKTFIFEEKIASGICGGGDAKKNVHLQPVNYYKLLMF